MAASSIQVTQGSGTRLASNSYTEGAVTVHDEKMILGEQYLPTYTIGGAGPSIATINSHLLQIMAGASLRVRIRYIEISPGTAATTALRGAWGILRLTSAGTGGTAITPRPLNTTDAASGATAMTLPTAGGTEGVTLWAMSDNVWQTMPANGRIGPTVSFDSDRLRSQPIVIPAGTANGIVIKNLIAVAGADVNINVVFDESSF